MEDINATFIKCFLIFDYNYINKNPSDKFDVVSKFISRISVKKLNIKFNDHPNKYKCYGSLWKIMGSLRAKNTDINITFSVINRGGLDPVLSLKKT